MTATAAEFRRALHARPELSGREHATAAAIRGWLATHAPPDSLDEGLGGAGLLCVYRGERPASVLLRAELDALPIHEATALPHASASPGVMHACGHDGHAAALCEFARRLPRPADRPDVGLLFQPAEEIGAGARAVLADPRFRPERFTHAFALHNLPGRPLAELSLRPGPTLCASTGLRLTLAGRTAHAAHPEDGDAPAATLARLIDELPEPSAPAGPLAMTTLTHAVLGEPTFGVTPGFARLHVTCRAETDEQLDDQVDRVRRRLAVAAAAFEHAVEPVEPFAATLSDPAACDLMQRAAGHVGLVTRRLDRPARWSEDFGLIADAVRAAGGVAAFGFLGAGEPVPPLHDPRYDFPDDLIQPAATLLLSLIDAVEAVPERHGPRR